MLFKYYIFPNRQDYEEDFSFDCGNQKVLDKEVENLSEDVSKEWYTVCGNPHSDYQSYVGIIAALGAIAIPTYSYAFVFWFPAFTFHSELLKEAHLKTLKVNVYSKMYLWTVV